MERGLEEEVLIRYYGARDFVIMIPHAMSPPPKAVMVRHSVM